MRKLALTLFALSLIPISPVFALDYPEPADPIAKSMVAQYIKDKPFIDSPTLMAMPNPVPAWPCAVPEIEQYKLAGLNMAHPELRGDIEKMTRKAFREAGMSTDMMPKTTYSNIQIIPLKAQCVNGKLDGELQILATYDKSDISHLTMPFGTGLVKGETVMNMHNVSRFHKTIKGGELSPVMTTFMQMTIQSETHYDNEQMEAQTRKSNEQLGLNKPTTSRVTMYTGQGGTMASFTESEEKKVSGGLFGVNVKTVPSLLTSFTLPIDAHRSQSLSYKEKQLLAISGMKDGKAHGDQVIYMDNYLKKINQRLDQQQGMENAREVTINGVDLIEQRNCYQNGAPVKISPCPAD